MNTQKIRCLACGNFDLPVFITRIVTGLIIRGYGMG